MPSTVFVVVSVKVTEPVGVSVPPPVSATVAVKESDVPKGVVLGWPGGVERTVEVVRDGGAMMSWFRTAFVRANVALPL